MVEGPDPTVHRRRLRIELRKMREAAGLTQREVAAVMDWSLSKLIRIETGQVNITTNDLRVLLTHYGVKEPARIQGLLDGAKAARERSPWSAYRDVTSPEFLVFLGYESSASIIRNFEPSMVPGLLQTEEYAHEILAMIGGVGGKRVTDLVDLRIERQERLLRDDGPGLHFIIDESVLHRLVGGADVMRRQLNRILELAERPNITVRIVTFGRGLYPRWRVPYVLFEFPDAEDEDVLYIEYPQGEMIRRENSPEGKGGEAEATPLSYLGVFFEIEQIAPMTSTVEIIQDALDRISDRGEPEVPTAALPPSA
jgi:transcriptional regulator with XRE-family HTH domain